MINEPLLAELIDRADVIFHLAAAVGVKLIVEQPVRTLETNVHGTEVVLKHASKKKKPVVIASTSEVYGKSIAVPFREGRGPGDRATTKHRWAYACSKLIDEFLALAYWKEKSCRSVVVRLFNTVGPRQTGRYGMVIPTFVRQALTGEPITVFGDGTQSRSFTLRRGRGWRAVEAWLRSPGDRRGVQHRRNGRGDHPGPRWTRQEDDEDESPVVNVPYDVAYEAGFEDMPRRVPDITKIQSLIGFAKKIGIGRDHSVGCRAHPAALGTGETAPYTCWGSATCNFEQRLFAPRCFLAWRPPPPLRP